MFIARKIKEDNIYILSYINRRQHVHRIIYWSVYTVHPVTWLFDRTFGTASDIYEGGNIYKLRLEISHLRTRPGAPGPPAPPMRLFKIRK